jgi:hypothetical protein
MLFIRASSLPLPPLAPGPARVRAAAARPGASLRAGAAVAVAAPFIGPG